MCCRALVVENDPEVLEQIEDVRFALGHDYDIAQSLTEARALLATRSYSYILSSLEIPARAGRSLPRVQNTVLLIVEAQAGDRNRATPAIIMTDHTPPNSELAGKIVQLAANLVRQHAVEFISKPFPTVGMTLDQVILKLLPASRRRRKRKGIHTPPKRDVQGSVRKHQDCPRITDRDEKGPQILTKTERNILVLLSEFC